MTIRQRFLKGLYPLFVWVKKHSGEGKILQNKEAVSPPVSFYSLSAVLNDGKEFSFDQLRGKKVLLVNTASDCGYTGQYAELQKLYLESSPKLLIIGFPANDFKEQEKGNDEQIAAFCQVNFGVSFPLAKKTSVVDGPSQNKIFHWLTHKEENGWNEKKPVWNFSKYLVDEQGVLTHFFEAAIEPLGAEILAAIKS